MIVTITLNPAIDRVLSVPDLKLGKPAKGTLVANVPAGKGVNVSRYLSALGVSSVATGFVGRREVRFYEESFTDTAITSTLVAVPSATRVSTTLLSGGKTGETHVREQGFPVPAEQKKQLRELLFELSSAHGPFVFAGSLPPDYSPAEFAGLITGLKSRGAVVIVDASGTALEAAMTAGCDLATPNEHELAELVCEEITSTSMLVAAARSLTRNVPVLAVKRGRKGGVFVAEGAAWTASLDAAEIEVVSTVGAGDAFLAGILAARETGAKPDRQLAAAVAAGCASVGTHTVGQLDLTAYETFLTTVSVREV